MWIWLFYNWLDQISRQFQIFPSPTIFPRFERSNQPATDCQWINPKAPLTCNSSFYFLSPHRALFRPVETQPLDTLNRYVCRVKKVGEEVERETLLFPFPSSIKFARRINKWIMGNAIDTTTSLLMCSLPVSYASRNIWFGPESNSDFRPICAKIIFRPWNGNMGKVICNNRLCLILDRK